MKLHRTLLWAMVLGASLGVAQASEEFYKDNLVVVLDASGSMSKTMPGTRISRMEAAKKALLAVLDKLSETTKMGLLVFSGSDAKYRNWVYPLGPLDKTKMRQAILGPRPGGGTPLADYLKMGTDRLLQEREAQLGYGSYRLLVVTDGVADSGQPVTPYAQDIVARGVNLDAIGVDMQQDHILAQLAHSYRRANDPASLERAVSEVFAEVGGQGKGGDEGLAEDFEIVGALSPDLAMSMIQALSSSGNHPIGSDPGTPPPGAQVAQKASPPAPRSSHASSHVPSPPRPSHSPSSTRKPRKDLNFGVWLVVGAFLFLFSGSKRAGNKKR